MNLSLEVCTGKSYKFPLHKLRMRRAEDASEFSLTPRFLGRVLALWTNGWVSSSFLGSGPAYQQPPAAVAEPLPFRGSDAWSPKLGPVGFLP